MWQLRHCAASRPWWRLLQNTRKSLLPRPISSSIRLSKSTANCSNSPTLKNDTHTVQLARESAGFADARHIERNNQPVFDPFGNIAADDHRMGSQISIIAAS
jgi:hypothetical protein